MAVLGEVHPEVARNYRISGRVYAAEIDLELLTAQDPGLVRYKEISRYPRADRDLAVLVARDQLVAELVQAIREEGTELLQEVAVFDVYQGTQVPPDRKSVAFALKFQGNRTLKEEEVNAIMERIIAQLRTRFGAEVR